VPVAPPRPRGKLVIPMLIDGQCQALACTTMSLGAPA
jgi:hypothetical protein